VHDQATQELHFWKDKLRTLNRILFWPIPFAPSKILFTDASSTGCGDFIQGSALVCHKNWSAEESQKSPTWRELAAINFVSIYTISDLGVLSNLIGSLSLANEHYSPPTE